VLSIKFEGLAYLSVVLLWAPYNYYFSERCSLESEVSQPHTPAEKRNLPISVVPKSNVETVPDVENPWNFSREARRVQQVPTCVSMIQFLSYLGRQKSIFRNHYTCRKNNCFHLTKKGQLSKFSLKWDHFEHQWVNNRNLAFDSHSGMWWLIEGKMGAGICLF